MFRTFALRLLLAVTALAVTAGASSAANWTAIVVNDQSTSNSVSPIDTGTNTAGSQIGVGALPLGVAITPDARTALVVNEGSTTNTGSLTPLDLSVTPPLAGSAISLAGHVPNFVAITPDGKEALVTDPQNGYVVPIDLTKAPAQVGSPIAVGNQPEGIAITPDGTRALVAILNQHEVLPITVATGAIGTPIALPSTDNPFQIAVTPDGSKAYVTNVNTNTVTPINLSNDAAGSDITVGSAATGIAITPDGKTAYVANNTGGTVTPITLATNTAGSTITVGGHPYAIAITPDGKTAYVTDGGTSTATGNTVIPIATATNTAGTAITVGNDPRGIAITPDQGPTANFTVTSAPAGQSTSFDASGSTVAFGVIATYQWNFGDGTAAQTTSPKVTHTYAASGSYTASVTETDAIGTSLSGEVFTGQTASWVGRATAATSRSVVVAAAAPQVKLSASSLDFGVVGVGQSAGKIVTIANTGNAPLVFGAAAITGARAVAFHSVSDGCSKQTIATGGSCAVELSFAPTAGGGATAQIAFPDNASGSPHTIFLAGQGTTTATITGIVRAAGLPVAGARTFACLRPNGPCQFTSTDAAGRYSLAALAPGEYDVESDSPVASLAPAAAGVIAAAGITVQDLTLSAPQSLPSTVTVNGVAGGTPTTFWTTPTDVQLPLQVPAGGAAGTFGVTTVLFAEVPTGSDNLNGLATQSMNVLYAYDKNGVPRFVSTNLNEGFVPLPGSPGALATAATAGSGTLDPLLLPSLGQWATTLRAPATVGVTDMSSATVEGVLEPPTTSVFHGATTLRVTQTTRMFSLGKAGSTVSPVKAPPVGPPASGDPQADDEIPVEPPVDVLNPGPVVLDPNAEQAIQEAENYANQNFGDPNGPNPGQSDPGQDPSSDPNYDICNPGPHFNSDGTWTMPDGAIWDPSRNMWFAASGNVWSIQSDSTVWWSGDESGTGIHSYDAQTGTVVTADGTTEPAGSGDHYVAPNGDIVDNVTHTVIDPTTGNTILENPQGQPAYGVNPTTGTVIDYASNTVYNANGTTSTYRAGDHAKAHPASAGDCGQDNGGSNYHDPSGAVLTTTGIPVAGARVTLVRAATKHGRFTAVRNGSNVMSPANRRNPDRTDILGQFGWDVLSGYYRVTAGHPGCHAAAGRSPTAQTRSLTVPPAVLDLRLRLRCPSLRRARSRTAIAVKVEPLHQLLIVATVSARRGHPQGLVVITGGTRHRLTLLVDRRTGRAVVTIAYRGRRPRVRASYSGDGAFAPSRSRAG